MASDQTPSNPNPTPIPPDSTPASASAARKLPIKRRSPLPSSPSSSPSSLSGGGDQLRGPLPPPQQQQQQPPFKFQRIWSESDELRFLQGLLGCGAQGLVFPRDLNVFYDQFSESMPQPYTRSQLSEKLRRLKNKYRNMSGRVARGLDPARLAPHDRDVLHLCSRLWDPASALSSPFASNAGASGNKRRRANPRAAAAVAQLTLPAPSGDSNSQDYNGISSTSLAVLPQGNGEETMDLGNEIGHLNDDGDDGNPVADDYHGVVKEEAGAETGAMVVLPNGNNGSGNGNINGKEVAPHRDEHRMANAILDVFEECLREVKAHGMGRGGVDRGVEDSELVKRWRAQRIEELDVLSRRLRLLVEDAAAAGHY